MLAKRVGVGVELRLISYTPCRNKYHSIAKMDDNYVKNPTEDLLTFFTFSKSGTPSGRTDRNLRGSPNLLES